MKRFMGKHAMEKHSSLFCHSIIAGQERFRRLSKVCIKVDTSFEWNVLIEDLPWPNTLAYSATASLLDRKDSEDYLKVVLKLILALSEMF